MTDRQKQGGEGWGGVSHLRFCTTETLSAFVKKENDGGLGRKTCTKSGT